MQKYGTRGPNTTITLTHTTIYTHTDAEKLQTDCTEIDEMKNGGRNRRFSLPQKKHSQTTAIQPNTLNFS
jgi:hypothetical protein